MSSCEFIKLLKEVLKTDVPSAGGKGANLGEMIKAGLPVPEGFVVLTNAYKKFVEENNLEDKLEDGQTIRLNGETGIIELISD